MLNARPFHAIFVFPNKKHITRKGLACSYYTTFLENSKMNFLIHENPMNAAPGLSILSLRSSSHLLRLKPQTCSDALKVCSGLKAFERNDTILSWHLPRSHGNGFGDVFGKWFRNLWQMTGCSWSWTITLIPRQERRSLDAQRFSTMLPSKISQNIHGHKTLSLLGC